MTSSPRVRELIVLSVEGGTIPLLSSNELGEKSHATDILHNFVNKK